MVPLAFFSCTWTYLPLVDTCARLPKPQYFIGMAILQNYSITIYSIYNIQNYSKIVGAERGYHKADRLKP